MKPSTSATNELPRRQKKDTRQRTGKAKEEGQRGGTRKQDIDEGEKEKKGEEKVTMEVGEYNGNKRREANKKGTRGESRPK